VRAPEVDGGGGVTIRRLVADDLEAYLRLRDASFGYPSGDDVRSELTARMAVSWGAFADGDLVASLSDARYEVFVAGVRVPMAGIAAVQTAPERRRSGLAARLMDHALAVAHQGGVGWSLLYPFDPRFYARYGWQSLATGVQLEIPPERLGRPDPRGTRVTGDLRDALQAVYERCAARFTFANARTLGPWDVWHDMLPPAGRMGLAYRLDDAFLVLQQTFDDDPHGLRLRVIDHGHATPTGRAALLGLLASFQGQASRVVIDVPSSDPLAWEWSTRSARRGHRTPMARPADVPAALSRLRARRAADEGEEAFELEAFTLAVRDPVAPWNDGSWRVAPGPDGCLVERAARAEATVDVRGLTLLVAGAATPRAVRAAGLAEGLARPLEALAALAGGRTPYQSPEDSF
jgi:predicted acetyltransferase